MADSHLRTGILTRLVMLLALMTVLSCTGANSDNVEVGDATTSGPMTTVTAATSAAASTSAVTTNMATTSSKSTVAVSTAATTSSRNTSLNINATATTTSSPGNTTTGVQVSCLLRTCAWKDNCSWLGSATVNATGFSCQSSNSQCYVVYDVNAKSANLSCSTTSNTMCTSQNSVKYAAGKCEFCCYGSSYCNSQNSFSNLATKCAALSSAIKTVTSLVTTVAAAVIILQQVTSLP